MKKNTNPKIKNFRPNKNPYLEVKRAWNEAFAQPIMAMRQWRLVALGELTVIISLVFYLNIISGAQRVVPYPVPVDGFGRVIHRPSQGEDNVDDTIIRAHLFTFIENTRSVLWDVKAMQKNLDRAYAVINPKVEAFLNQYFQENNSLELSKEINREITPTTFLKESDETFLIEWREVERDLTGSVVAQHHWKALISITQEQPKTTKALRENPFNPFGLYIESLSWDLIQN